MELETNFGKTVKKFNELIENPDSFEKLCGLIYTESLIPWFECFDTFKIKYEEFKKSSDNTTKFLLKFIHRNMDLFRIFLQILLHTKQYDAAMLIANEYLADILDLNRCHPSSKFVENFSFGFRRDPNQDKLKKIERSTSSTGSCFPMISHPRGYCVLINNYLTFGTYKEMQRFRNIFYQLHFDVIMKQNLNYDELNSFLLELSKRPELSSHSAIFFIILTHGTADREFLSLDGKEIKIQYLVDLFNNKNCPLLVNKPRVFIMNCCRGDKDSFGIIVHNDISKTIYGKEDQRNHLNECLIAEKNTRIGNETTLASVIKNPCQEIKDNFTKDKIMPKLESENFLVCYTSLNGYKSYVNWESGTDFGRIFADKLVEFGWYKNMYSIITRINNSLDKLNESHHSDEEKQPLKIIEFDSCLRRSLYFYPQIPREIEYPIL